MTPEYQKTVGLSSAATVLRPSTKSFSDNLLQHSAKTWFVAAVMGQWIFTYYIFAVYWLPVGKGESDKWNNLSTVENFAFMVHVGLALAVFLCGPLQLIPKIRTHFPTFHRWNGRLYLFCVALASGAGLHMVWDVGTVGGLGVQIGTTLNALLVAVFAWQAVRYAIKRELKTHQRWALRLFISAVAVWFFRVEIMVWFMLTGGIGIDPETFEGPALIVMSFTQYLLPLAGLELYFYAQKKATATLRYTAAVAIFALTGFMLLGTYAATMGMWLPRI